MQDSQRSSTQFSVRQGEQQCSSGKSPAREEVGCWVCNVPGTQMLLSRTELSNGSPVSVCRGCVTSVMVVEQLRLRIQRLAIELDDSKDGVVLQPSIKVEEDDLNDQDEEYDIKVIIWNKAIRVAAREAANDGYSTADGLNLRISESILELRK